MSEASGATCERSQSDIKHTSNRIDRAVRPAESKPEELQNVTSQTKQHIEHTHAAKAAVHPSHHLEATLQATAMEQLSAVLH